MSTAASATDRAHVRRQAWNAAMTASPGDLDIEVPASQVVGAVPAELRGGVLFSNGPGWTRIGGRTAHPFDGHGYVRRLALGADGSVSLKARFVRTPSYLAEKEVGRLVHRGFATNVSGKFWENLRSGPPRNVANTTIVSWQGKLLAGWEGGSPYALDPTTLATLGEHVFGGVIEGAATLAHMRQERSQGRITLCNITMGRSTGLVFHELDASDAVLSQTRAEVPGMLFLHDYALSPSWFVVGGNPLRLKAGALLKSVTGLGPFFRAVTPDTRQPGTLHLLPRGGDGELRTVTLPGPAFVVHFGNAFERADGTVVVDAAVFDRFDFGDEFGYQGPHGEFDPALPEARGAQRLVRITVPPGATEASWERLTEQAVDFPTFHPAHAGIETPRLYGATRRDKRFSDPFDSIIAIDLLDRSQPEQIWTAADNLFVGEPIFAPLHDDPADGHLLVLLTDGVAERTTLAIFRASDVAAGPVAEVPLPLLPVGFHGEWVGPQAG